MKRLMSIIEGIAVISFLAVVSSCQEYLPFDDHDLTVQTYEKDFVSTFGKPAENHSWGFVAQTPLVIEETRAINTDKNSWFKNYYGHLNIPGFPDHLHGYFRGTKTVNADGTYSQKMTKEQVEAGHKTDVNNWVNNNVGAAVGDVTDEEREFVWKWFHTHKNPTSTAIHWENFFVQNVSSWKLRHPNSDGRNMDHLGYENPSGQFEHINNYNAATGEIMYVYNAGTAKWSYWASFSSTYQNDKFNIQHLIFEIPQTNCPEGCSVHHYDGWYVAFDYEAVVVEGNGTIRNGSVYADGYYDDWIVKVSPGNQVGYPETVRVMCEDLGQENSDWDFNDVVFDVSFRRYGSQVRACIAIQAAGGTLPITVGTTDMNYEVHKLLGSNSMDPIIHPSTFAYYEVDFNSYDSEDNLLNARSIPVYINGSEEATYYTLTNSNIAQKFACPDYVPWTNERQPITVLYPEFSAWVKDAKTSPWSISNSHSSIITETAAPNAFINSGDDGCDCETWRPGQAVDGQNGTQENTNQESNGVGEENQTPADNNQTPVVTPEIDENAVSVFSGSKTMNNWGDAAFTLLNAGQNNNLISSAINAGKKQLIVTLSSCETSYDVFLCTTWLQDTNLGSTQTVTVDSSTSLFSFSLTEADANTISQAGLMLKVKENNNTDGGKPMIISSVVLE